MDDLALPDLDDLARRCSGWLDAKTAAEIKLVIRRLREAEAANVERARIVGSLHRLLDQKNERIAALEQVRKAANRLAQNWKRNHPAMGRRLGTHRRPRRHKRDLKIASNPYRGS